jgi:hypothetical protein
MKKIFVSSICCLLLLTEVRSQGIHLGIKGGSNLGEITGNAFSGGFNGNLMLGAFAELNLIPHWGIQPEILFSQTTSQTADNFSEFYQEGMNSHSVKLQYMSIPILLTWQLPVPILSLQLGPEFGTILNNNTSLSSNGAKAFKTGNFSMDIGAQVNLLKFKGGIRYVYGFTDINNMAYSESWKLRTVQLYVGFRIF